jgi:hypothetical protein
MNNVKLSITVDNEEVFQTNGIEWKMCGAEHKEIVLSALSESMVMICGGMAKPEVHISYHHLKPAPVLTMVPQSPQETSEEADRG